MSGLVAAGVAAAAGIIGGLMNNEANRSATAQTNAANRGISNDQMAFQERMSSSAYQRAMVDMKKAGLNPMLAYQQGGASAPSGAGIAAQAPNYQDPIGPAVNSGMSAYEKTANIKNAVTQLGINQSNATADVLLKNAQAAKTVSDAKNVEVQGEILRAQAIKSGLDAKWFSSEEGQSLYQLNRINEAIGGSLDNLNSAKDLVNPFSLLREMGKKQHQREKWKGRDERDAESRQEMLDKAEALFPKQN